jgi:hypothetical protein
MKPSNEKGVCEENAIEDKSSTVQFVDSGESTPTGEKTAQDSFFPYNSNII